MSKVLSSPYIQPLEAFLRQAEAGRFHNATAQLPEVAAPALVVAGERDCVTPPSLGKELAKLIPGARMEIIKGAGHAVALEKPQEFNQILLDFL